MKKHEFKEQKDEPFTVDILSNKFLFRVNHFILMRTMRMLSLDTKLLTTRRLELSSLINLNLLKC